MTIDERFEYLQHNIDSLHATAQELTVSVAELARRAEAHEREMQRFRRAMRAALVAWLDDQNGDQSQQ